MTEVYRRKLALDKYTLTLTAVTLFYSRISLKKLTTENKTTFRKLEKSVKFSVKCDADIKFINFCIENQLLLKFVKIRDVQRFVGDRNASITLPKFVTR